MQDPLATERARRLRADSTKAEARLWEVLRGRRLGGWKWRRQVPCGPFIADFLCRDARLVVELDGGQNSETEAYDARRTAYLESLGLRVMRFWNFGVLEGRAEICDSILEACGGPIDDMDERLLSPRLRGERVG